MYFLAEVIYWESLHHEYASLTLSSMYVGSIIWGVYAGEGPTCNPATAGVCCGTGGSGRCPLALGIEGTNPPPESSPPAWPVISASVPLGSIAFVGLLRT